MAFALIICAPRKVLWTESQISGIGIPYALTFEPACIHDHGNRHSRVMLESTILCGDPSGACVAGIDRPRYSALAG